MGMELLDSQIIAMAALVIFILAAAAVVAVLWIAMPFSVFGTKSLIRRLIEEQERTNRLLMTMLDAISTRRPEPRVEDEAGRDDAEKRH